ncbi:MAG: DNA ligase [Thiovulaceae bacterium]|nr:DNA ligase [Sulfurimonadaceae bacterium]
MIRLFAVLVLLVLHVNALTLQKPNIYHDQNISGWMMSEKLDGIRGYWDGKQLLSRQNKPINAPKWFTQDLPPFALDGELWTMRADFENIQSIVMDDKPSEKWKEITYNIFEVPNAEGNFTQRLQKAQDYISAHHLMHVRVITQKICNNKKELKKFLDEVLKKHGEGAVIKDGSKNYFEGRSDSILKVKLAQDMEGKVIGYKAGTGKYKGMMGSLKVELESGEHLFIGTGFSDETRKKPPILGSIITFKYFGFTKKGKPRFASYMRVRKD